MKEKRFIFLSKDGFTYSPVCDSAEPDVSNLQVLGIAEGLDESEAYGNLLELNPWITSLGFEDILSYELVRSMQ